MRDLKLALVIEALVKGAKDVLGLTGSVKELSSTASKPVPDNTEQLRAGVQKTKSTIQELQDELTRLVTLGAIVQFSRSAVQEFSKAESAVRGLEAVANASGAGIGNALKKAEELAADGLIGVSDASKALQNLLSRGYNLDRAVATITRLKDAAAFNRQASLSMAEAVVSATEGLKNENSILVDNAGVTKNVAKMWEEYAKQRNITTGEMTQAQKIEAEFNGIMAETAAQVGNAAKAQASFQGEMARSEQATLKFKQQLGESLVPVTGELAQAGVFLVNSFLKPLLVGLQSAGIGAGFTTQMFGVLWDAITTLDFNGVGDKIQRFAQLAEDEIAKVRERVYGDSLKLTEGLTGGADPEKAKEVAAKLTEGAGAVAKAQKDLAKDLKESIKESIKGYELLAEKARESWQKSLDAEKDYLDKAKAAEAQAAAARVKDSSVEGQASAQLDVIAAQEKLLRLQAQGANVKDIETQAEVVRALAGNLDDQARAQEAVKASWEAVAAANRKAAEDQKASTAGLREQWDNAQRVVDDLKTALEAVGKRTAINIESEQAKIVLAEITAQLDALKDKTITVKVVKLGADGQPLDNLSTGVPGHALGTILPGYGGGDRRLILAEDGEAITRKEAVAYYGRNFLAAINAMQIPRFQSGGLVMSAAGRLPSVSGAAETGSAPAIPHLGRIDLGLGGDSYPVYAAPDVAESLGAALRQARLRKGR